MNGPFMFGGGPLLTEGQKVHAKEAMRSRQMLSLVQTYYSMFLAQNIPPVVALSKAQEGAQVWMDHEDANWIDPPEISQQQIEAAQAQMQAQMQAQSMPAIPVEWFDKFAEALQQSTLMVQGVKKMSKKEIVKKLMASEVRPKRVRRGQGRG